MPSKFSVKSLTVYKLTVYAWFENEHLAFDVAVKLFIHKSNKGRVTFYYCLRKMTILLLLKKKNNNFVIGYVTDLYDDNII